MKIPINNSFAQTIEHGAVGYAAALALGLANPLAAAGFAATAYVVGKVANRIFHKLDPYKRGNIASSLIGKLKLPTASFLAGRIAPVVGRLLPMLATKAPSFLNGFCFNLIVGYGVHMLNLGMRTVGLAR